MMRKEILLPGLAVACGIIAAAVRRWTLSAAFEPDTGLAVATHPSMLVLIVFTAAFALGMALLCRSCPATWKDASYHRAFYAPEGLILTVTQAAAIVVGLAAMLMMTEVYPNYLTQLAKLELTYSSGKNQLQAFLYAAPELVQALLGLAAAVCLFFMARELALKESRNRFRVCVLIPAFYACFWLINVYRDQATNPVVLAYAWHLFAILCVVMAMYYAAGFSYGNIHPRLTLYFSLLGIFFCLTTLADSHGIAELLTLAAFTLWLLSASVSLLRNLLGAPHATPGKRIAPRHPVPADDEDDDVDIVL